MDIQKHPTVTAPAGVIKGSVLTSLSGLPLVAYRGIPFALPPVGPLRFAKPVPHPHFEGVFDATQDGPIGIQPMGVNFEWKQQEDCLYLNVFTPVPKQFDNAENASTVKDEGRLKKVMVFIHGGGFFMGCANQHVPGDFVAQGDVIIVTINYRLSWLGFVKGPVDEIKGNMGMWDQLEALKWVKANIQAFGGDADDITLAGQSMGGESVSAMSVSPLAKDLFTKGILMSGTMFTCKSTVGSSDVLLDMLINKLGLDREGKEYSDLIKELRDLPEERFILPLQNEITNKFTTIDTELFPKSFEEMKQDKEYLSKVGFFNRDYLVSLTNNEGQLELSSGPFAVNTDKAETHDQITLAQRLGQSESLHQKLKAWYELPGHHEFHPIHDLFSDPIIMMPSFEFLQVAADPLAKGCSYFLWFDHKPSYASEIPSEGGVLHGLDLCYLLDIVPDEIYKTYSDFKTGKGFVQEDEQLKKLFIGIIVDFMSNRNMNSFSSSFGRNLPPFEATNEYYLNFGNKAMVKQFPLKERRNLWKTIVPEWKKEDCT